MKKRFDNLSKKFFHDTLKRNPVYATYLGIHRYDTLLPKEDRRAYENTIKTYKKFLHEFKKIKLEMLDFERRITCELAIHNLTLSLFYLEELRQWEKNPDIVSSIGDAIFPLFVRDFAPFEKRISCIIARLEKAEKIIKEAKTRLHHPIRLWTEMAIESCDQIPSFLEEILTTARAKKIPKTTLLRLEKSIINTKNAVVSYKNYLQKTIIPKSKKEFAIGEQKFRKLIALRKLGMNPEEILGLGEDYLKNLKKQLLELASKIKPQGNIEEAQKIIEAQRPNGFDNILATYRQSIKRARRFIRDNKFATMPTNEELRVVETPTYLRHVIPFAAYFQPAKFDKKQIGIYVVTPTKQGNLGRYNYADICNTSVHEGYPGHHLQLSCANTQTHILRLILEYAPEFVEGWAHYCEEHMRKLGYDTSVEGAFVQTKDMIWRAARIIIDVKLSTGKMSFDEAVEFLMKEGGKDKEGAIAEIKRYTMSPTYQLSYLLGKHQIKQMKKELQCKYSKKFSERLFHDTLLYAGSLPIFFHKRILEERFSAKKV